MDILCLKLHDDLTHKLTEYIHDMEYDIPNNLSDMITEVIDPSLFIFPQKTEYRPHMCHARIWDKGLQCNHASVEGGNYCGRHLDMINYYGILRFGDITDKKPVYDLIKLRAGHKEKLRWIQPDPIQRLQHLLDKQQLKVIRATPHLIVR
jgi:hypothetical protein